MSFQGNERLLPCPYNPSHQIIPLRMAKHLVKCKKSHPEMDMSICPFNATHHVPRNEFQNHFLQCEDKMTVEREMFLRTKTLEDANPEFNDSLSNFDLMVSRDSSIFDRDRQFNPPSVNNAPVYKFVEPESEDWDLETTEAPTYNVYNSILHKNVSRMPPVGLGKSARKTWRDVDAMRMERIKNNEPIDDLVYPTLQGEKSIGELMNGPVIANPFRRTENIESKGSGRSTSEICKSLMRPKERLRMTRMAANFENLAVDNDDW